MGRSKIGFLSIGQSPRPDLVAPLAALMPEIEPVEAGALDDLAPADIPAARREPRFPLTTRLRSGAVVSVEERDLVPLLSTALARVEAAGVAATLLLCAGTFAGLSGRRPLFTPFPIAQTYLGRMGYSRLLVVCPIPEQVEPIRRRWRRAGFVPTVHVAPSIELAAAPALATELADAATGHDCVFLDYVGHPPEQVQALQAAMDLPVIDLGLLAVETLLASKVLKAED